MLTPCQIDRRRYQVLTQLLMLKRQLAWRAELGQEKLCRTLAHRICKLAERLADLRAQLEEADEVEHNQEQTEEGAGDGSMSQRLRRAVADSMKEDGL